MAGICWPVRDGKRDGPRHHAGRRAVGHAQRQTPTSGLSPCLPQDTGREPLRRVRNFAGGGGVELNEVERAGDMPRSLSSAPPTTNAPPRNLGRGAAHPYRGFWRPAAGRPFTCSGDMSRQMVHHALRAIPFATCHPMTSLPIASLPDTKQKCARPGSRASSFKRHSLAGIQVVSGSSLLNHSYSDGPTVSPSPCLSVPSSPHLPDRPTTCLSRYRRQTHASLISSPVFAFASSTCSRM